MTAQRIEPASAARRGTFDLAAWKPERARLVAASCVVAFAGALWTQGSVWRLAAALLLVDAALQLLPWRLPRAERPIASVCIEEAAQIAAPTAFLVLVLVQGRPWATAQPAPWWFAVGAAVGAALIVVGGMPIRLLVTGALAFAAPPLRRPHKLARAANVVVAPPGEEALFRGIALAASGAAVAPLGILAGAAFVARHHLPPGLSARTPTRTTLTQLAAAAAFLALTLASGSIFPALVAHYVNNAPSLYLELGRPTREG